MLGNPIQENTSAPHSISIDAVRIEIKSGQDSLPTSHNRRFQGGFLQVLDAWISRDELIWQILCLKPQRIEEKAVKSKPPSQK